jgi:hypothetical protein
MAAVASVVEEVLRRGIGSVGDDDVAARRAEEAGEFGSWAHAARIAAGSGERGYCLVFVSLGVLDLNRVLLDEELRDWAR